MALEDPRLDFTAGYPPLFTLDPTGSGDAGINASPNPINSRDLSSLDQWLTTSDDDLSIERPITPADESVVRSYHNIALICYPFEPWNAYEHSSPLSYIISRIKGFVTDMVNRSATPFLHRHLYLEYTPQCILACISTSALYENRTSANMTLVMRAVNSSVRELIYSESGRTTVTPRDKLARVHSLLLYQIIRLFDGDITLRAQGETDIPLLRRWLNQLCSIRDNLGYLAQMDGPAVQEQAPAEWKKWIFAESMRRTIVIAYSILSLYEKMKGPSFGDRNLGPWAYVHRWTIARSLWEAQSRSNFDCQWKRLRQFIIVNYSFETFLQHGKGEDVDEFAEILLSLSLGREAAVEFISPRAIHNQVSDKAVTT